MRKEKIFEEAVDLLSYILNRYSITVLTENDKFILVYKCKKTQSVLEFLPDMNCEDILQAPDEETAGTAVAAQVIVHMRHVPWPA